MNILYYCNEYPPFKTGGIGSVTKIVGEELAKRGHNVYVVGYYPYSDDLPEYSDINGVHIYRLNIGLRRGFIRRNIFRILHRLSLSNCIIQRELDYTENFIQELIVEKNIDILELTDFYTFNSAHRKLKFRKFNIPTILRVHGSISFINSLSGIRQKGCEINDALHFMRCDFLSAVSNYSLKYVENNFNTEHFIGKNVIYNPIEEEFLNQSNKLVDNKTILFVGKLTETKGCYSLLKAFNHVAPKYRDWKLIMVGKGDQKEAESFINPENKAQVSFLGFCSRDQLKQQIDNCSFVCIPTYFENFSMAALEVMARQKALIFTERTSGKEVVNDGDDGLLVNPENIEQIAEKISLLIEYPDLRNKIADNAYLKVKNNFLTPVICNKIETFYKGIITKNN